MRRICTLAAAVAVVTSGSGLTPTAAQETWTLEPACAPYVPAPEWLTAVPALAATPIAPDLLDRALAITRPDDGPPRLPTGEPLAGEERERVVVLVEAFVACVAPPAEDDGGAFALVSDDFIRSFMIDESVTDGGSDVEAGPIVVEADEEGNPIGATPEPTPDPFPPSLAAGMEVSIVEALRLEGGRIGVRVGYADDGVPVRSDYLFLSERPDGLIVDAWLPGVLPPVAATPTP